MQALIDAAKFHGKWDALVELFPDLVETLEVVEPGAAIPVVSPEAHFKATCGMTKGTAPNSADGAMSRPCDARPRGSVGRGEKVAEQLLVHNLLGPSFPAVARVDRQVCKLEGPHPSRWFDFLVHHQDAALRPRIVEVKMVVDAACAVDAKPERAKHVCRSDSKPCQRAAIFPHGSSNQKGPDEKKVVSALAIHHVQELTLVTEKQHCDTSILFVVVRGDARHFRQNHKCCPSFCKCPSRLLGGRGVLAKQVRWCGEGSDIGKCFEGGLLDIRWLRGFSTSAQCGKKKKNTDQLGEIAFALWRCATGISYPYSPWYRFI
jgi:hypothetical protein